MIARSFRPVGWVAAVGAAALGCYMLSLRVAAERADLDRLDARIVAASQEIRSLQTELGTRGRMQQLEEWNNEVLALAAPVSGQFVEGGVSLARFDIRQPQIAPEAEVRLASAEVPAAAAPASRPAVVAPAQPAVAAPAPAAPPLVRRVSATVPPAATPPKPVRAAQAAPPLTRAAAATAPTRTAAAPERPRAAPPPTRTVAATERNRSAPAAAPRRTAGLLDERTMRDLSSASRAERGGGTTN